MTDFKRSTLRLKLQMEWVKACRGYEEAGAPFGTGRGLEVWVEYGQLTTVN